MEVTLLSSLLIHVAFVDTCLDNEVNHKIWDHTATRKSRGHSDNGHNCFQQACTAGILKGLSVVEKLHFP